ncbi:hypothetical protein HU727_007360 [Pseudomonas sp. SWRI153]|uniref:Ig-like domain (Group 3) n=1 Tax=Pseudomonas khorasanensis TaxID=2745508 RepID=A0A923F1K6_9PSED|nr:hypothetical protein [Pseudomonas khorasanensis]
MTVPLGPVSLVATQTFSGNESERSTPRAFKIRPPALTGVTDDILSATSVKFSGSGHEGAFVEITIVSGPAGAAPPVVQVVNGKWETTATNWPLGNYSLSAIQKVPDNSNGWIASPAYTFPVNLVLGPPTGVTYTAVYTPTFSGSGVNGATIEVTDRGSGALVAGAAPVVNQAWSTKAYTEWGPTKARPVRVVQKLGDTVSDPVDLLVTIAPLAPVINDIPPGEVSPLIDGTCWPGAVVKLKYSDQPAIEHLASVTGGVWSYRRTDPFTPENYTVTVTQTAADQLSPPASKTFTVLKPIPKPTIDPLEAEVGRDLIVTGGNGLKDATLQLRDAQFDRPLGQPKLLTSDGPWSIELKTLEFRHYTIDAQQSLDGRQSLRSEPVSSIVVLLPPTFEVPQPGSDLPRTSQLSGTGMPRGRVEVWLVGATEPLLKDIAVSAGGRWEAEVTLPIGVTTIRAKQFFEVQTSRDSPLLTYNVVPAAPFIETPTVDEHIGPRVVVSGFGVPGDTVTVKLGESPLGSSPVLEDRTWSVTVTLDHPGGVCGLVVAASSGDFESSASARSVVLGTYLPSIDVPAAGRWVNNPVVFEGLGRQGVGQVVSWYNPDVKWSANLPVGAGGWQGEAIQPLPGGGHWGRFKQTITDGAGAATVSDWVESERFEGPAPASN